MGTAEQLQMHLSGAVQVSHGYAYKPVAPFVRCVDGSVMSVQASASHYCSPRENAGPYTHVEVWCIECPPPYWYEYGGDGEPFAYIPTELVVAEIDRRGGFAE